MSSVSPGGADLVPTAPDWYQAPSTAQFFVGIFLHSVSASANMYHINTRAGELPRSASSHFVLLLDLCWQVAEHILPQSMGNISQFFQRQHVTHYLH